MKISVVTAVFNRSDTIADAMKSVQSQSYANVEHIVQDGGSDDGTQEVITQMAGANTQLVSEPDDGLYDAINRGIQRATGDVIGLMHSDDFFADNNVLSKVAERFAATGADGVYGDLQYVAAGAPHKVIRHWRAGEYKPAALQRGWMPPHPTFYLRREVFDRYGLYDTDFSIAADYDAMLRYLAKAQINIAYIPEVLVKMRLGGESNRSIERIIRKSREDLLALQNNGVGGLGTLLSKNFSKLGQFLVKGQN